MRYIGLGIGVLISLLLLSWIITGNNFLLYQVFAPRTEAVHRQVFEESKAYQQGMIQELQNMQFQYEQATDSQKAALAAIILHRAADVPRERLPQGLQFFLATIRDTQGAH